MAYIQGEGRGQGSLFPVVLDDLVPDDICVASSMHLSQSFRCQLGFERAQAAETGRPGYDPGDLLKLYLYGYLNQIRSSRRLEAECRRNVELMWLLGRLYPDHKSISEFRRMHPEAVTAAGAALIRFARSCGLIRGEWIAIDGSSFALLRALTPSAKGSRYSVISTAWRRRTQSRRRRSINLLRRGLARHLYEDALNRMRNASRRKP